MYATVVSEVRVAACVHTRDHWRAGPGWPAVNGRADRPIRRTTIGCVTLLPLIARTEYSLHTHPLMALHAHLPWVAALTPLSVYVLIATPHPPLPSPPPPPH